MHGTQYIHVDTWDSLNTFLDSVNNPGELLVV